jgi:hypothetical protein
MFGQSFVFGSIAGGSAPIDVDFLVIAGGGAGGAGNYNFATGAGGNGGGLRTSYGSISGAGCSTLSKLTFNGGVTYAISVGGGTSNSSISGSDITTVTAIAGQTPAINRNDGAAGAACNQYGGGTGISDNASAGGGSPNATGNSGTGADGLANSITGSSVTYAGGGGGGTSLYQIRFCQSGGSGGGGRGAGTTSGYDPCYAQSGSPNTGGGGGGRGYANSSGIVIGQGGGGSGVVILRMPTANYSGTTTGSPTVTTDGTDTILTFTGSGSYTH